jgi:hypothetical protein
MGMAALAGCGEIVPINPDGGIGPGNDSAPPDAVAADNADLAILDLGAFGDVVPEFSPDETSYTASFSLLVQRLEVTARPVNPLATVSINGVPVTPGQPSDGISLDAAGDTPISIEVQAPAGNSKTYSIVADRGAGIEQYVYGKASNPGGSADPFGQDGNPNNDIGDEFAFWLDVSGDTVVVAAHLEDSNGTGVNGAQANDSAPNSGAVYVYRRQDNAWKQEAYLKASNTDAGDEFGRSVAIDGDVLVVGAPFEASTASGIDGNESSDGLPGAGAVYIYRRTGTEWRQEAYVKASDPQSFALFGVHVALRGDTLIVGAPGFFNPYFPEDPANETAPNDGAAYVFRYNGFTWEEEAILKASNPEPTDQFGFQVALDDDTIAVSAIGEASSIGGEDLDPALADNLAPMSGAVYVFERQQDSTWLETDYIKAQAPGGPLSFPDGSSEVEGDRFGIRIELDNDTLVVGAHLEDSSARAIDGDPTDNGAPDAGAAFVFRRDPDGDWTQEAYLKPDNLDELDFFGQNFGLSNDLLAVAANGESSSATGVGGQPDNNDAPFSGAVYLYRREGTTWEQIEYIKASNTESGDNFGFNMDMSSNTLVIGALWEWSSSPGINGAQNDEDAPLSGAFYIFQ